MTGAAPNRRFLDFQADRIENVLASHRVPARVHGGEVSPRWVRFHLSPAPGARIATVRNLSEELALALGAPDVRVARDGEMLAVEIPRPDAEPVRLLSFMRSLPAIPPLTACLGIAEDGRPLLLRLPSPSVAHVLVAGTTGSGKTELIRSMVLSLALRNRQPRLQVVLIDPKRRGLEPLAGLPHVLPGRVLSAPDEVQAVLERMVAEMERRDGTGECSPHILIAIDEALDVIGAGGRQAEELLNRIARRGREAGLHLLMGVQKPSATALGGMLRANFPVRLVGRVTSGQDALVAAGVGGSGAEKLIGRGDFLAVAAGEVTRFQAAWIAPSEWGQMQALYGRRQRLLS